MWRQLPIALSAITIIAGGIIQGNIVSRWGRQAEITSVADSLKTLPATIGAWDGYEIEVPAAQLKTAEVTGCLSRRYVNRVDGNTITLLIFSGRPGPVSMHPPTVCFPSAGLTLETQPTLCKVTTEGVTGEFWYGDFVKLAGGVPVRLRTYWTWHGQGGWQVPNNPRVAFAREPYIYKMYVTQAVEGVRRIPAEDPCIEFIRLVLPELQSALDAQRSA